MQLDFASASTVFRTFAYWTVLCALPAALAAWTLAGLLFGRQWPRVSNRTARRWSLGLGGVAMGLVMAGTYGASYGRFASMSVNGRTVVLDYLGPWGAPVRLHAGEVDAVRYRYFHRRGVCAIHLTTLSQASYRSASVRVASLDRCLRLHDRVERALGRVPPSA